MGVRHRETQIGFVVAVLAHRLIEGHAWKRPRRVFFAQVNPKDIVQNFEHRKPSIVEKISS